MDTQTLTIDEAAAQGIERLRRPNWANPMDHIKIDIIDGKAGPWIHLYSIMNRDFNGRDPVNHLFIHVDRDGYLPYTGALPDSEEYKAEEKKFSEFSKQVKEVVPNG